MQCCCVVRANHAGPTLLQHVFMFRRGTPLGPRSLSRVSLTTSGHSTVHGTFKGHVVCDRFMLKLIVRVVSLDPPVDRVLMVSHCNIAVVNSLDLFRFFSSNHSCKLIIFYQLIQGTTGYNIFVG